MSPTISKVLNFLLPIILLMVGSVSILHSITPELSFYQLISISIGILILFLISRLDSDVLTQTPMLWYGLSVGSLLLTELFGVVSRGSARWITVFGQRFQTSEFAKVALILFAAGWLQNRNLKNHTHTLQFLGLFSIPCLLVFIQPDLGSAMMLAIIAIVALIVSGAPAKQLVALALIVATIIPVGLTVLKPYQKDRLTSFLNPQHDPLGKGYNATQATIAVGSGQLVGRGLGQGTQSHLKFLPERQTDFIFSSYVEELGFIGGLILIAMYGWLSWRLIIAAKTAASIAQSLICLMSAGHILTQALVNIGMNMGILPITGVTLPLVSYGGSSMVSTCILLGINLSVILRAHTNKTDLEIR